MKNLYTIIMILCAPISWAQDIHFTQNANAPQLNPALTGIIPGGHSLRIAATHRDQWTSVIGEGKYQTSILSVDHNFVIGSKDYWAIGATALHDVAGKATFRHLEGHLSGSYMKMLYRQKHNAHFLGIGARIGGTSMRFDPSANTWSKQFTGENYNTSLPSGESFPNDIPDNLYYGDLSAGIAYHFSQTSRLPAKSRLPYATIGFSFQHIGGWIHGKYTRSSVRGSDFSIAPLWRVHGLGMIAMPGSWYILPTFSFSRQQRVMETQLGLYARTDWNTLHYTQLNALQIGFIYRLESRLKSESIAPALRMDFGNIIGGISYDLNLSRLRAASRYRGGFEFSFIYLRKSNTRPQRSVECYFF